MKEILLTYIKAKNEQKLAKIQYKDSKPLMIGLVVLGIVMLSPVLICAIPFVFIYGLILQLKPKKVLAKKEKSPLDFMNFSVNDYVKDSFKKSA